MRKDGAAASLTSRSEGTVLFRIATSYGVERARLCELSESLVCVDPALRLAPVQPNFACA
jgi:hypothetical protein